MSNVHVGRRGNIGIGIETTAGSTVSLSRFIPYTENTLQEMHEPISDNSARGVRDLEGDSPVEGKKWGEGDISVVLDPEAGGFLFALALGQTTVASLGSGLFRHTLTRKTNNDPITANIWNDRVVDQVEFPYCCVDSLEINFSDNVASAKASIISRYPIDGRIAPAVPTPSYEFADLYTFKDALVEVGSLGSTTTLKVREFSMNISNNLEAVYAPNSNDVDRIVSKGFQVTGSFRVLFENETHKDAFTNITRKALGVVFEGDNTGKISIYIPKFRIQGYDQNKPIDDLSEETIEFVAEYNGTNTVHVMIENEQATYG